MIEVEEVRIAKEVKIVTEVKIVKEVYTFACLRNTRQCIAMQYDTITIQGNMVQNDQMKESESVQELSSELRRSLKISLGSVHDLALNTKDVPLNENNKAAIQL